MLDVLQKIQEEIRRSASRSTWRRESIIADGELHLDNIRDRMNSVFG
jgi:hypothetical protein